MSLILNCQEISKSIGPRCLFDELSFTVSRGDRLAVIGANGSGKSTLLRVLSGLDTADKGKIDILQNSLIAYLPQQEDFVEESTVADILFAALENDERGESEQHSRVQTMLSRADFDDPAMPVHILSGGWRKRLAICRALIRQPDLLMMDEPTNHLDLEGILWLEKLLGQSFPGSPSTFIMVSHDRFFLENLATRIMEIAPFYPGGYFLLEGNYSTFLQRKEQLLEQLEEKEARLANRVRSETEWLKRGPKARTTKARFRVNEAHRLAEELGRLKSMNRAKAEIKIDFDSTGRKTKKLLETHKLGKSFDGNILFQGIDIVLSPGKRIGLLGRNGSGKSTLMQILAAANDPDGLQPDNGYIRTAEGVRIIYFAQDRKQLQPEMTLRQTLSPEGDSVIYRDQSLHVVTWAQKFLFRPDQLDTPVGILSGGEKARILIADLMRQPADILLLDEPTNDLDIPSLQVLEESLLDFPGAVVLVTHDRYLLNRCCGLVLGFTGQGNVSFFADYEQWFQFCQKQEKNEAREKIPAKPKRQRNKTGRLSYLDQREYDAMEDNIHAAEQREQELLLVMENPDTASNQELLEKSWMELEEVRNKIDQLYSRWDELEQMKNSSN